MITNSKFEISLVAESMNWSAMPMSLTEIYPELAENEDFQKFAC